MYEHGHIVKLLDQHWQFSIEPNTFGTLASNQTCTMACWKIPSEDDYPIELPIFGRSVHTFSHVVMDFWLVDVLIQFVEG
jgi:hypothetical protein